MKVSILGLGHVGSATAFALALKGLATEIVLISRRAEFARGEAEDLNHVAAFKDHVFRAVGGDDIQLTAGSQMVIVTDSAPNQAGNTSRDALAADNVKLFRERLPAAAEVSPDAVFVVVTNPVDVMTWFAREFTGLDASRVLGVGTLLDTARLRSLLSAELKIHPDDVRAYVIGEHGDNQVVAVDTATAGGQSIEDAARLRQLGAEAAKAGYYVFSRRGYTNFAIATAVSLLTETIKDDLRRTLPVSLLIDGYYGVQDVCLSLPAVVGRHGVQQVLVPKLGAGEAKVFHAGAAKVRRMIAELRG